MEETGIQPDQPGQTVTPTRSSPDNTPPTPSPPPSKPPPEAKPAAEAPKPAQPAPQAPEEAKTPENKPFNSESGNPQAGTPVTAATNQAQAVSWTASEFIAHAKSFGWYAGLAVATSAIVAAVFFITKDKISVGVVIIGAILLGVYGAHKPRQMEYQLDNSGLSIGQKHFGYSEFRSFSVIPEDAFASIVFMPLKRFALPTTIYFAPEDEDRIVKLLAGFLPFEEGGHDAVDRLMQRIRF